MDTINLDHTKNVHQKSVWTPCGFRAESANSTQICAEYMGECKDLDLNLEGSDMALVGQFWYARIARGLQRSVRGSGA